MKISYRILLISLVFNNVLALAQNGTSSPYSFYNIGDISPVGSGRSNGLGGAGIALPSETSLNNVNPASYGTIDSLSFLTDFGLGWKQSHFTNGLQSQLANNFGLNFFAIGFRNTSWWKNSIGIAPFSSIGNNFNIQRNIDGSTDTYNANEQGSGGVNQFYWGNAFTILPNLSIGVNVSFLFGNIKQTETITSLLATSTATYFSGSLTTDDNVYLHKFYLNYGLQYKLKLSKQINGTFGAIYGRPTKLTLFHEITTTDNSNNILQDEQASQSSFTLPGFYGFGISLKFFDKLLLTSDYKFYNWSKSESLQTVVKLVNSENISVGAEYTPSNSFRDRGLKKITYRIGGYVNNTYMMINGQQLVDRGMSFGLGLPIMQKKLFVNMAYQIGQKGTSENRGIINENYQGFSVSISLLDFWFFKPKFD